MAIKNKTKTRISVILLTYNSTFDKIKTSLLSVINQRYDNFEIIIADDGSDNNYFERLSLFFQEKNFVRYQLVDNGKNGGTVSNLINAIKFSTGEYIKPLGQGDSLSSNQTLNYINEFINENACKIGFGRMKSFYINNQKLYGSAFTAPEKLELYTKTPQDKNKICKEMFLYRSLWISGSTMFYKKDYLSEKLLQMSPYVTYAEDLIQFVTYLEGDSVAFLNKIIVNYEANAGMSFSKGRKANIRLDEDIRKWYLYLNETYNNKYLKKGKLRFKNGIASKLILYISTPKILYRKIKKWLLHIKSNKLVIKM